MYICFRWQCASIVFCTCSCEGGDSSQREGPVESPRQRGGRGFACSVALLADEQLWQVGGRCWDEGRGCRHRCRQRGTVITIVRPRRTARQIPETDRREPVHCWVSRRKYFFSYCYGGRLYCVSLKVVNWKNDRENKWKKYLDYGSSIECSRYQCFIDFISDNKYKQFKNGTLVRTPSISSSNIWCCHANFLVLFFQFIKAQQASI